MPNKNVKLDHRKKLVILRSLDIGPVMVKLARDEFEDQVLWKGANMFCHNEVCLSCSSYPNKECDVRILDSNITLFILTPNSFDLLVSRKYCGSHKPINRWSERASAWGKTTPTGLDPGEEGKSGGGGL